MPPCWGLAVVEAMFAPLPDGAGRGASRTSAAGMDWRPVTPVPEDAPPPPESHPKHGRPSGIWAYRDESGGLLGYVWRFDNADGEKSFVPVTWCIPADGGPGRWRFKGWRAPRPLYGLDQLVACGVDATAIVAEGEKAADGAQALLPDWPCLTSPNGALAADKADWRPLTGRRVVLWPDADAQGLHYAAAVGAALEAVDAEVRVIEPPAGGAKGWDAADARAEGWDEARTLALIEAARPLEEWRAAHRPDLDHGGERPPAARATPKRAWPLHHDSTDDCPLTPLGHHDGRYWFLSPAGEVRAIAGDKMHARGLASLVDGEVGWFIEQFGSDARCGFNDYAAANSLRRACRRVGLFDPATPQRGPEVWREGNELIVHAGDSLLVGCTWQPAGVMRGCAIYPAASPIGRPAGTPARTEAGRRLLETLRRWNFTSELGAELVLGFIGQAFLSGALTWRSHMAVTGERGTGKSLLAELVAAALGGAAHEASSDFTEAGLRQALTGEARALILDEAEQVEGSVRIREVIRLLRLMSGGGTALIRRGSAGGAPQQFRVTGVAFLVAVLLPALDPQDRSRITSLELDPLDPEVSRAETLAAIETVRAEAPALWARAISGWPRFLETLAAYRDHLIKAGCTARAADQLATLASGRDLLLRSDVPDAGALNHAVERLAPLIAAARAESKEGEGFNCWTHLITSPVDLLRPGEKRTVGDLLKEALTTDETIARQTLEAIGIKIAYRGSSRLVLVANNHGGLERIFKDTRWASKGWCVALRYLDGARAYPNEQLNESVPRFGVSRQRATAIPATLVTEEEAGAA